jgi:hypothetical protein
VGRVLRGFLVVVSCLALLSGCGTASFSNSVAVIVPSPQQVSVFDSQMGESAEWAGQWLEPAAPGKPYTRQVPALDTKFIGDNSPPAAVRLGIYLPDRTQTGYFSLIDYDAEAGVTDTDLPFVAWFSESPVPAQPPLPVSVELQPGPNGWLVNVTVEEVP